MALKEIAFMGRSFSFEDLDGKDLVATKMASLDFEPPLPVILMATICRTDGTFLDVGANTGLYSVLAGIARPEVKVISFEPYAPALKAFRTNIAANRLEDRVTAHQIALSDKIGMLPLYIPNQGHGLMESSASLEVGFGHGKKTEIEKVPVKTLDSFGLEDLIGVIKVDIEGHEHCFLKGARHTIECSRPIIFIEILPVNHLHHLQNFVRELGYVDFRLRPDLAIRDDAVRFDRHAWNHAFVPPEKLGIFYSACITHGIEVARVMSIQ